MARFPKARSRHPQTSTSYSTAKAFYGDAFESDSPGDLAESMADWGELSPDEQRFTVAHLYYLGLQAQGATHRLLRQIIEVLEDVEEGLDELAAPVGAEEPVVVESVVPDEPTSAEPPSSAEASPITPDEPEEAKDGEA